MFFVWRFGPSFALPLTRKRARCLQHGGSYKRAPPFETEPGGYHLGPLSFIKAHPRLDWEVSQLHERAREGALDARTAECYINSYLACAAWDGDPKLTPLFKMALADAPQPGTVPDVGKFVRLALKELDATRHPVAAAVLQAVPCFKKSYPSCKKAVAVAPLKLNILLATLLGLYDSAIKKPQFTTKVEYYREVHRALTSEEHEQVAFLARYEHLESLSFMEYVTRALPDYMPSEHACLKSKYRQPFFWDRLPLLCDQLRATCSGWDEAEQFAAKVLEKITRVKRKCTKPPSSHPAAYTQEDFVNALACPWVPHPQKEDFHILSQAYGAPACLLETLHTVLRVGDLPQNLAKVQVAYMRKHERLSHLAWHMSTHWHICVHCLVVKRTCSTEMKLDTITQRLKCSTCKQELIASVDFLGRVVNILNANYVFCPVCAKIHKVQGQAFPGTRTCYCRVVNQIPAWPLPCDTTKGPCACERPQQPKQDPQRCEVCGERHNLRQFERVDHLTGRMECIPFCGRHAPDARSADWCQNAEQLRAASALRR